MTKYSKHKTIYVDSEMKKAKMLEDRKKHSSTAPNEKCSFSSFVCNEVVKSLHAHMRTTPTDTQLIIIINLSFVRIVYNLI